MPRARNSTYRDTRRRPGIVAEAATRPRRIGNLGSFGMGFLAFILLSPVRSEGGGVPSCESDSECRGMPA